MKKITQKRIKELHNDNELYLINSVWDIPLTEIEKMIGEVDDLTVFKSETNYCDFSKSETYMINHKSGNVYINCKEWEGATSTIIYLEK